MRKQCMLMVTALGLLCTACGGSTEVTETEQETVQETVQTVTQEAAQENSLPEEVSEPEKEEPEESPFEEDTNVYGNSMGNLNNEGFFVKCDDKGYIERNVFGQTYLIDQAGEGTYIEGTNIYSLNYCDGQIYGIWVDEDQEKNNSILTGSLEDETIHIDTQRRADTLYVVNGIVYYTEAYTHKLYCYDPEEESGEDTLLVDSAIYYPVFYKDRIIYQADDDEESLYSIPLNGGESTKLNDMHSHWPIVYKDKIYYQGIANAAYTLRCMELDGSEDQEIAKIRYSYPVVCGDKLCVIDESNKGAISYLELDTPENGFQVAEVGNGLIEKYAAYENTSADVDITQYKIKEIDHMASIDDKLLFWAYFRNDSNNWLVDAAEYDFASAQVASLPYFDAREIKGEEASENGQATEVADLDMSVQEPPAQPEQEEQPVQQAAANTSNHNYYLHCTQEQADQADAIAKQIADSVMGNAAYTTDLQKVEAAAKMVQSYCDRDIYGADDNKYYRSPYGVFVSGNYTCAGSTRALGRVLDYMGYSWQHMNENKWVHQWCIVTLDGQTGFADGMGGCAGYGEMISGMTLPDGRTIYFPTE